MIVRDLVFRLKPNLFQRFHRRQYCKNGGEKSFTTYLWSKVDVRFCERLYIIYKMIRKNIFDKNNLRKLVRRL